MDEGKNPFFAVRRSSVESSPNPVLSELGLVVRVAALSDRSAPGDQEAREIPVTRPQYQG